MNQDEFVQGLRDMADFFENSGAPVPESGVTVYLWETSVEATRARAIQMAPCEKIYSDSSFYLVREFGPHRLEAVWNREQVCDRVQVGTTHVPAYVVEAHDEPVYEWDCNKAILGTGEASQIEQGESN